MINENNNEKPETGTVDKFAVIEAGRKLRETIIETHIIPDTVDVLEHKFTIPEFLYISAQTFLIFNNNKLTNPEYKYGVQPPDPIDDELKKYTTQSYFNLPIRIINTILQGVNTENKIPKPWYFFKSQKAIIINYKTMISVMVEIYNEYSDGYTYKKIEIPTLISLNDYSTHVFFPRFKHEITDYDLEKGDLQYKVMDEIKEETVKTETNINKEIEKNEEKIEEVNQKVEEGEKPLENHEPGTESQTLKKTWSILNPFNWF